MARRPNRGLLGELTKVKAGEQLTKVITASRINAIQEAIRDLMNVSSEILDKTRVNSRRHLNPFQIIDLGAPKSGTKRKVEVAWGTVTPLDNSEGAVTIAGLDTSFDLEATHKVWIMAQFNASGAITSCVLKKGVPSANGWTVYPSRYEFTGSSVWNEWYHPIAEVRSAKTGKTSTAGNDLGEHSLVGDLVIAQLTNTHLVVVETCVDGDKIFALLPGPGATSTEAP